MEHKDYRLAAILFTDIVGFSRMMEKDETGTLKLMEYHNSLVRSSVTGFGGNIIKTIGDAFLIEFSNANNAIRCAVKIQNELETFNAAKPLVPLVLRIGCHLGDIYFFDNDALGEGINIASRLQSLCHPGRICMSQEVYNLVSNKVEIPIKALGSVNLKNITRELNAYEIMTNGAAQEGETSAVAGPGVIGSNPAPAAGSSTSHDADYQQIRRQVFKAIKESGRRLTVDEARRSLGIQGEMVEKVLSLMVSQGFLSRANAAYDASFELRFSHDRQEGGRQEGGHRDAGRDDDFGGDALRDLAKEIKTEVVGVVNKVKQAIRRKNLTPQEYLAKQEKELEDQKRSFHGHMSSFVTINLGLIALWAFTTGIGGFPWFFFPLGGWGIGMVSHWVNLRQKKREVAEQRALPPLTERQLGILRNLFKERRSWVGHAASNFATMIFLAGINLITSPGFPWSLFPAIGMLAGIVGHRTSLKHKEAELLKQLSDEGLPVEILRNPRHLDLGGGKLPEAENPQSREAERLRQRILKQYRTLKDKTPLGEDFVPVLDNYVSQIKVLTERSKEIDALLAGMPVAELEREREAVRVKRAGSANERMNVEYDRAIEQFDKQIKSHRDMVDEHAVLGQRLSNAINSLRQLEIDLGRVKSLSVRGSLPTVNPIRDRNEELRKYLEDLSHGYQEAEAAMDSRVQEGES